MVPGGGPWAEEVRRQQARWGFGDGAAHRMALLAMDQYGEMIAALDDRLSPVAEPAAMEGIVRRGRVPVWLPSVALAGVEEIEQSWRVTSDSLAAWLARRLGATELVLLKAAALPDQAADAESPAEALAAAGVVDASLPSWVRGSGLRLRAIGSAGDPEGVVRALERCSES